jgi:hypothetical protein
LKGRRGPILAFPLRNARLRGLQFRGGHDKVGRGGERELPPIIDGSRRRRCRSSGSRRQARLSVTQKRAQRGAGRDHRFLGRRPRGRSHRRFRSRAQQIEPGSALLIEKLGDRAAVSLGSRDEFLRGTQQIFTGGERIPRGAAGAARFGDRRVA